MAEELTDAAAAELAGLAERATKGPWSVLVEETHKDHWRMRIPEIGAAFPVHKVDDREIGNAINDVAYIAAACNLSPALLAERQRLRAEVERLTRELPLQVSLVMLWQDQSEWSQRTFGEDGKRGPVGPLKHLEKEAVEAQVAYGASLQLNNPEFREEMADCFLLLLDAARRGGMSLDDLFTSAIVKHAINRQRKWARPTSDAPVFHTKDSAAAAGAGAANNQQKGADHV